MKSMCVLIAEHLCQNKVSMDDDAPIDLSELEKELNEAIEADARYWRENDAKFRAVNQRVASYDEFREIVKAAHLKPLDKDDKIQDTTRKNSIWNSLASKKKDFPSSSKSLSMQPMQLEDDSVPTTTGEFLKQWRVLNCTDRFILLRKLQQENLQRLFNLEIPMGVLGDIFQALLLFQFSTPDVIFVIRVLEELSKSKRFDLSLQFLSSVEKEACKELLTKLSNSFPNRQQDLAEEGITEWTLFELRNKYQM